MNLRTDLNHLSLSLGLIFGERSNHRLSQAVIDFQMGDDKSEILR